MERLCDITIRMELEKLAGLIEAQDKIYKRLEGSKVERDHKLVMAYNCHTQERKYLQEYRNEDIHN
jgi:hypothetical protein